MAVAGPRDGTGLGSDLSAQAQCEALKAEE